MALAVDVGNQEASSGTDVGNQPATSTADVGGASIIFNDTFYSFNSLKVTFMGGIL